MNSHETKIQKTRMRLIVALPVVMSALTLAVGFLAFSLIEWKGLVYPPSEGRIIPDSVKLYVVLMGVGAGIVGFVIAQYISKTLSRITSTLTDIGGAQGGVLPLGKDEITTLSGVFDRALLSVSEFVSDRYILDNLEDGIISIDADGILNYMNPAAEKIVGCSAEECKWEPIGKCFPSTAENRELLSIIESRKKVEQETVSMTLRDHRRIRVMLSTQRAKRDVFGLAYFMLKLKSLERLDETRSEIMHIDRLASLGFLINGIAHEIRTPLSYIRGLAEIQREEAEEGGPGAHRLDALLEGTDRLNILAEELLVLSNRNTFSPLVNVHVKEEIEEAKLSYEKDLSEKGIHLIEDHEEEALYVKATSQGIRQVLSSLLENATQHTPTNGFIKIVSRLENGDAIITIFNSDSHIPPELAGKIFNPFFTTRSGSIGLGLFITKHILESFQGSINVESSPEQGTTFTVSLPVAGANLEK